jgi:hypothetical protein
MTDELKFPDPGERPGARDKDALDERAARLIRAAYRPPVASGEAENAYWDAIERRIMARVSTAGWTQAEPGWWSVLGGWAQVGLVAAAALFATAGLVSTRFADSDDQVAYESIVSSTPDALYAPAQLVTSSDQSVQRDAALQYVLSY